MFFSYPSSATSENWLHECLVEMITTIHNCHENGNAVPIWPNIIPTPNNAQLKSRTGLKERLKSYETASKNLSQSERQRVLTCLNEQNCIAELVTCTTHCQRVTDLPQSIIIPIEELFGFAFKDLLKDLGVRGRQYKKIYENSPYKKECPFCGCESFDAPTAPSEDLDHYLAKSLYPFAAVNLQNLVPMGKKCNEKYKLAQDILRHKNGNRRRAFNPYTKEERRVRVVLNNSYPFGDDPKWQIEFDSPDTEECETWDDVFRIRERIQNDVLEPWFRNWLEFFSNSVKEKVNADSKDTEILAEVRNYAETLEYMSLTGIEFLRLPVFQMLLGYCEIGDQKVLSFVKDLLKNAKGEL